MYIVDTFNHRIQKWSPGATEGITVAGGNGNGSASNQFDSPYAITLDIFENLYIADNSNHRIQKWSPGATEGITVAGGNGEGSNANQLFRPYGITLDLAGNMYIADNANHRIQKWSLGETEGITVAGGNGKGANANQLSYPNDISLDSLGNLYVLDTYNYRIQKWVIGQSDTDGDGVGNMCDKCLDTPLGEIIDTDGCSSSLSVEKISFVKKVYPNSTSNELMVELNENIKVNKLEFINLKGKIINPANIDINKSVIRIDVSNFNNGIYILNLTKDSEIFRFRIAIKD
tara:strand:- start:81 stop:944 length:864 start_codon:yes stop_codon:yes gene_type:complete